MSMTDLLGYVAADAHWPERADAGAWAGVDGVKNDSIHAIGEAVGLCLEAGVPLFLAGDNFDGPDPEPAAVAAVYQNLRRLEHDELPVYYVLGNHDGGRDWLAPLGNTAVNVSDRVVHTPQGASVTGLSYVTTVEEFINRTAQASRADIGLYHQSWSELSSRGAFSLGQLPDHGVSVCGDVHVRMVLDRPEFTRKIVSPGPLSPQSVAEFFPAAVYAVYRDFSVREVRLAGRRFLRLDVESVEDAESAMRTLTELGPDKTVHADLSRPMVAIRVGNGCRVNGFAEAAQVLAAERGVVLRMYSTKGLGGSDSNGNGDENREPGRRPVMADLASAIYSFPGVSRRAKELAVALATAPSDLGGYEGSELIRKTLKTQEPQEPEEAPRGDPPGVT